MGTMIFDFFGLVFCGAFIIETVQANYDDIVEIQEKSLDDSPVPPDRFDLLYMSVADGDLSDYDYWIDSIKKDRP